MKSNVLRFDYWFSFNYKRLRSILGWQLNEDVFSRYLFASEKGSAIYRLANNRL